MNGAGFETLCLQELLALNHYLDKGYEFFHWRTRRHEEVDLILYGENGFHAFEFKSGSRLRETDFATLRLFAQDYPQAQLFLVHAGNENRTYGRIRIMSARKFFAEAESILN